MEQLQSILMECGGPDAEEVKAFFRLHRLDQACATCLVLACCRCPGDAQVSRFMLFPSSGFLLQSWQCSGEQVYAVPVVWFPLTALVMFGFAVYTLPVFFCSPLTTLMMLKGAVLPHSWSAGLLPQSK